MFSGVYIIFGSLGEYVAIEKRRNTAAIISATPVVSISLFLIKLFTFAKI